MKKMLLIALALCLIASLSAFAHDDKKMDKEVTVTGVVTDPMCAKSGDMAKMTNEDCAKRCAKDGKLSLVTEPDGKVWAIENNDAVKGHEGHKVKVTGNANAEKMTFHVKSVSMEAGAAPGHHDHDKMKKEEKKEEKKPAKAAESKKTT